MLERFSITISAATIAAVLGKLALLYSTDRTLNKDWLSGDIDQTVLCNVLLALFLIFFRGKMMHDDASFFVKLTTPGNFKEDQSAKFRIRIGLLIGYISWLLWAPAIFFLEDHRRFAWCLIISLLLSTVWLLIDLSTRQTEDPIRAIWVFPNLFYIVFLLLLQYTPWAVAMATAMLLVLIIEWFLTDPFSGHLVSPAAKPNEAEKPG